MSYDQKPRIGGGATTTSVQSGATTPGKRTLTEDLPSSEAAKGGAEPRVPESAAGGAATSAAPAGSDGAAGTTAGSGARAREGASHTGDARVTPTVNVQVDGGASPEAATAKQENTKPAEAPNFDGAAGENTCQPKSSAAKLDWEVKATDKEWTVNVTGFTVTGAIKVAPWPSKPTEVVTPNTANPVDGGNITDAAGNNNWKFAIKEMEEYNQANGGRTSYWHSYEASKAHEWAHWNTDYMKLCVGKYWPQANKDLDAISIPKAEAADAKAAKAKLQAKVDTRLDKLRSDMIAAWNAIPDSPGAAEGAGYKAGQAVLDVLIAKVRDYATKKGWK